MKHDPMYFAGPEPLSGLRYLWVTNEGAAEITLNSILSFLDVAPEAELRIHIGCVDEASMQYFRQRLPASLLIQMEKISAWKEFARVKVTGDYNDYGSIRFRDVSFARYFALMHMFAQQDGPIMYTDGDIAFLSDPHPHLVKAAMTSNASVLIQSDLPLRPESVHDKEGCQILAPGKDRNLCTGFTLWPDRARAVDLCQKIIDGRDAEVEDTHDQKVLNSFPDQELADLVTLSEEVFPNGSYFFEYSGEFKYPDDVIQQRVSKACMVHANWMVGISKKTAALRKLGLWYVDEAAAVV